MAAVVAPPRPWRARTASDMMRVYLALVFHEAWLLSGAPKGKNAPELG